MGCKYVLCYMNYNIFYFNEEFELWHYLNSHKVNHGVAFEDDPIHGPCPYYTFPDKNYYIIDLVEKRKCRIYCELD